MAGIEYFKSLFDYNAYANVRILEGARKVDVGDYFAETDIAHGSLHGLLFHMLRVENTWRTICETGAGPNPPLELEDFPDLPALEERWKVEAEAMNSYISGLGQEGLDAALQVTDWRGREHSMLVWRMLLHLGLHSMQHHSEVAVLLTRYGQSPGNLDYIFFRG